MNPDPTSDLTENSVELDLTIALATVGAAIEDARSLFQEYQHQLGLDLSFQGFAHELATLPGHYAAPLGALLVAYVADHPAGCCALRPMLDSDHSNAGEMKRLFVRPAYRGFGLGRQLVEQTLTLARQAGYDSLLLDTLDDMEAARTLYQELGFEEIAPYYHNPVPGAHYLKVQL